MNHPEGEVPPIVCRSPGIGSVSQLHSDQQYEEFLALFTGERERLFRYIFSLLPNHADAEDVFQRCSLILWRKFSEFDRERSFFSWSCGIALHEIRNFLRSSHRQKLTFDSELVTQLSDQRLTDLESTEDNMRYLANCLERLPHADRELVQVAYDGTTTLKKFSRTSGQALQTLYNRLGRLRRQLLDCVRKKATLEGLP